MCRHPTSSSAHGARRCHPSQNFARHAEADQGRTGSERDVVIHVAVAGAGRGRTAGRGAGRTGRAEIAAGVIREASAPAAAAIQHGQGGVKPLQHHFGGVFLGAALVGPFAGLQAPSTYTFAPFFRYCSATLASPSLKITTRCHSVFSLRSPVALSRQVSDVATLRLAIGRPSGSAGFPDPCRDCRPESPCSRFPPLPLSTHITGGPPVIRPPLSAFARHLKRIADDPIRSPARPARVIPAIPSLSTYSTGGRHVPVLFRTT